MSPTNFHRVPPACVLWNFRKERVIEQILSLNADVICLQEIDHYEDFFKPLFTNLGYSCLFFAKNDSPCLKMPGNNGPDGVTLFYRISRLNCLEYRMKYLANVEQSESNQPVLVCMLADKISSQNVCVAVTHFKAKKGFEELRIAQARDILKIVEKIRQDIDPKSSVLICGDFNGEPTEGFYPIMEDVFQSAYKNAMTEEVPFTTWKIRQGVDVKHTIDYIWYLPDKMDVVSYLATPAEADVPEERFPSFSNPSDHLAICCDFSFK